MPISPNQTSENGGIITITGVNLSNATAYFGTKLGIVVANTPTMISVLAPSGCGAVIVRVVTPGGTSNGLNFFYVPFPIVSDLMSDSGSVSGGNTVLINGYNLYTASSVDFGGNAATPTIINDGQISVTAPASSGPGSVLVSITTAGGTTSGLNYNYFDDASITSLSPVSGPSIGGTSVTIYGSNFSNITNISLGGNSAAFGIINNSTVAIITPSGSAGLVDLVITTTSNTVTAVDAFTYISSPGI
jgi:hypothetical protein